jgi:hypothetical protein
VLAPPAAALTIPMIAIKTATTIGFRGCLKALIIVAGF